LAKKWDLPVKEKPESQEICFFGDKDYRAFLRRYLPEKYFKPGKIVDKYGNVLGKHQGLINYTIGQRKGVEQSQKSKLKEAKDKEPLYVIGFDIKKNWLIVGEDKDVYKKEMIVNDLNWINSSLRHPELVSGSLKVKIRYRHPAVKCSIKWLDNNKLKVLFNEPQRAITPGQSAVFYLDNKVLGGGIIM
jgi:tRNA-specific 2-thiouridylase